MKYTQGRIGRIFVLRFDDGDVVLDELKRLAKKEKIRSAVFLFLGALKKGHLVTGPKKPVVPPEPNRLRFKDGWEALGAGTLFPSAEGAPQIHIHASMGRKKKVLTGCVRGDSEVFLMIEAVVFELTGVKAEKNMDPKTGLNLLRIVS